MNNYSTKTTAKIRNFFHINEKIFRQPPPKPLSILYSCLRTCYHTASFPPPYQASCQNSLTLSYPLEKMQITSPHSNSETQPHRHSKRADSHCSHLPLAKRVSRFTGSNVAVICQKNLSPRNRFSNLNLHLFGHNDASS